MEKERRRKAVIPARVVSVLLVAAALFIMTGSSSAVSECLNCHEIKTPGIVKYWKESAHYSKGVGCEACHGADAEENHKNRKTVDASKCGSCHEKAAAGHSEGRHSVGLKSGAGCTRNMAKQTGTFSDCLLCHRQGSSEPIVKTECAMFLSQTPQMQRQGCGSCHMIESRCDKCHTKHGTDLKTAASAGTCGVCHMGPDHPQLEMWEMSMHGALYGKGETRAPTCVTCHMRGGTHNVGRGIAYGLKGKDRDRERNFMVGICSECHSAAFSSSSLDDDDKIEQQASALVDEAGGIVESLQKEGLLSPSLSERPPHPLFGEKFVLGPHMLYENLSRAESIYFKMKQFYYMSAFKGAYHQNPDYAHWYGNAPLKLALSELKSEAALLRLTDTLRKRIDNMAAGAKDSASAGDDLKRQLRELNDRRLRGDIPEDDYIRRKNDILKRMGL